MRKSDHAGGRCHPVPESTTPLRAALAAAADDRIIFDLDGIAAQYAALRRELPGISVRFAMKACPVDEVLACLARQGCGVDAASPPEIAQALRTGVPAERIHYGNTIKSDSNIAEAYRLGIRDFATDSTEDVTAIAVHAPGSRVFCRLATSGDGALWGLSRKFGYRPHPEVTHPKSYGTHAVYMSMDLQAAPAEPSKPARRPGIGAPASPCARQSAVTRWTQLSHARVAVERVSIATLRAGN
ncbi:hypothetical protein AB0H00_14220 [Nocardia sp. NPDC023852]|uniref:hypothetical protein n=1 Tax=Nocardia sp. NPDC023852 TaxID=3154697 RepID=UPI0033D5DF68